MRDMHKLSEKNREYRERYNPCFKEEVLSLKCLKNNDYNQEKCYDFFINVKICREFWDELRRERRSRGIKPELPYPNERKQIKEEYLKNRENMNK
ncbi:coiled-coil-helix-coiled-coil-helix domain-containing protein 7 [Leptopilina boulardi]|uniref:coiled-coil-helix-coiled-coil-helix domain-containing protein 7 n=1 Tax=Leptopilina boulardi TaxID=63433 RepID=UPI0021F5A1A1|nr:coiled-coil-helix-coiled-coil-helix domain-containing protein 7 [Leptopilina boulardi]